MSKDEFVERVTHVGEVVSKIEVSIGPRFLDLFSSQLYSSPNKAFEELVSNSWDAGAQTVYIGTPHDLSDESATVWVLDDGESMDLAGLRALWRVAKSPKRVDKVTRGRPQIGKFGIGKLATYLLAAQLTYVCKASDGVIRAVTMDYRDIDTPDSDAEDELAERSGEQENGDALHKRNAVELDVRVLDENELHELLHIFANGSQIDDLIDQGVPKPKSAATADYDDEFGGPDTKPAAKSDTWTLALLTSLKPAGKSMKPGVIQWLLRTALPLGSSIAIDFNGDALVSSKINVPVVEEWVLGESLGITSITVPSNGVRDDEVHTVTEYRIPYPHVRVDGIDGAITGRVRRYAGRISGGKSDAVESSNGFLINILGRVINPLDPYFGLKNLNHTAWAQFRATIRADGLDQQLGVNREGLREGPELEIFQAFLRALFNRARSAHDAAAQAAWPKAGEVLTQSWSAVPFEPLRRVIADSLSSQSGDVPEFIDAANIDDRAETLKNWEHDAVSQPARLIEEVVLESIGKAEPLVKYELARRRVVVNRDHPFSREYGQTHEQQLLLRDTAFVELLTEAYMLDVGISEGQLQEIREYKDQAFRLIAQVRRRTGTQLAEMLVNATDNKKALETIVSDALEYLGFDVTRMAQPGFPEGVATAPTPPDINDKRVSYSFTFDAKSAKYGKVQTGNVGSAGLVRHREDHDAEHILVVAPDYEVTPGKGGQLPDIVQECQMQGITPMRAGALAKLLMLAAATGPLNLTEFRSVFALRHPDAIDTWVADLTTRAKATPRLSLDLFLAALAGIGYSGPNAIHTTVIADRIHQLPGERPHPSRLDIRNLAAGLAVLVPSLVRVTGDNVYLSTSPQKLREAIVAQIQAIPPEYRFGIDETLFPAEAL